MTTPDNNVPAQTTFVAPPLEQLNELLDGYQFDAFISQGGMGAVYKATQTSLDRDVAIKVLPKEFGADEEFRESFQHEARLMAKLNHPNLIGVYDFGDMDGMLYIIMELVKGKSLYHSSHGRAIIQDKAASIIRDVCLGLQHAHDAGILHRDIKPANILLDPDAKPKIGDFGLARPAGMTETGVIYGTPGYTAPEVLESPESVDERADVFAVGVMLYELLAGQLPEQPYVAVTEYVECDARFDRVIRKAINPRSNLRYASAQALADDISDILNDLGKKTTGAANAGGPPKRVSLRRNQKPASGKLQSGSSKAAPVRAAAALATPALASTAGVSVKASSPDDAPNNDAEVRAAQARAVQKAKSAVMRNLVIIVFLLGAVYVTWEWAQGRKEDQKEAQAKQDALDAKTKAEKDRLRKERAAELEAERQRALAAQNNNGNNNNSNNGNNDPDPKDLPKEPDPVIIEKTPFQKIENLRYELANGERPLDRFPEESFKKNNDSRILLYINKPMTWHEADQWCQQHGGYLAVCRTSSDWHDLTKRIAKKETIESVWLGGGASGSKGWSWVDGTDWGSFVKTYPTSEQKFLTITKFGIATPQSYEMRFPFYIEWRADGTNPGQIDYRLQRTSDQLTEINPVYLPGTVAMDVRHYYVAHGEYSYDEAKRLAEVAGGHLAVPRDETERKYIETLLASTSKPGSTFWIAGKRKNNLWVWETNELWKPIPWDDGYPKKGFKLTVVNKTNAPIRDANSSDKTSGFIIEWSEDYKKNTSEDLAANPQANSNTAALKKKATKLVKDEIDKMEAAHESNVDRVSRDIRLYLKGLPKGQAQSYREDTDAIIAKVAGKERVPEDIAGKGPSARVRAITLYSIDKQKRIDKEFEEAIMKLHGAYLSQLNKIRNKLLESGQQTAVKAIDAEGKAIGKDAQSFIKHFGF